MILKFYTEQCITKIYPPKKFQVNQVSLTQQKTCWACFCFRGKGEIIHDVITLELDVT